MGNGAPSDTGTGAGCLRSCRAGNASAGSVDKQTEGIDAAQNSRGAHCTGQNHYLLKELTQAKVKKTCNSNKRTSLQHQFVK